MNCKPGDLARVVEGKIGYGRIVRCLHLVEGQFFARDKHGEEVLMVCDGPTWALDGFVVLKAEGSGKIYEVTFAADRILRPIRDPGEDAKDETLSWLPVPLPELV